MAGSLNKVMLIGNLGTDPEIRSTNDNKKVATLKIATSERWKDKNSGERHEKTEWHRVVIFTQPLIDVIEKYLKKGQRVYIEGQLQTRKWTDQENRERFTTEIVVSGYNGNLVMLSPAAHQSSSSSYASGEHESTTSDIIEDDMPPF